MQHAVGPTGMNVCDPAGAQLVKTVEQALAAAGDVKLEYSSKEHHTELCEGLRW